MRAEFTLFAQVLLCMMAARTVRILRGEQSPAQHRRQEPTPNGRHQIPLP
jgi:hypothetical protein